MATIKHLLHINASREVVYETLTTINGLASWWTAQITGDPAIGGTIQFRFTGAGCDMKVASLEKNQSLEWQCTDGWPDWIGTTITFLLDEADGKTRVRFAHANWKEDNDFFAGCSFSWARFLESLRQYCQNGKGEAFGTENYRK